MMQRALRKFKKSKVSRLGISLLSSLRSPHCKPNFNWVENKFFRELYWECSLKNLPPRLVQIEFNGLCNRRCSYCPVSIESRPNGFLSPEIYDRILHFLADKNFDGQLHPNFYNEPLLFKKFDEYVTKARQILPKAEIVLNTNGDLLTVEKYEKLRAAGVTAFLISQHDPEPSEVIQRLVAYSVSKKYQDVRVTNWTTSGRVLTNRAGLINDDRAGYVPEFGCGRALDMQIDFEGNVLVCCEDFYSQNSYGNVTKDRLKDIWRNSETQRKNIYLGNYEREICKVCAGQHVLVPLETKQVGI